LAAQSAQSQARGEIRGVVVDSNTNAPLADVEILASRTERRVRSNERGQFRLTRVDVGIYVIVARKAGFSPESLSVMLDSGEAKDLRIELRPVTTLGEVEVSESPLLSARLQGFEYRRTRKNGGQFITREQIEARGPIVTADLLRRMQGIRMVDSAGVTVAISSRAPKVNLTSRQTVVNCVLRVGVDGSVKEQGFPVNLISTKEIYGIEVYSGPASLPAEFNSARRDGYCGLIMIWTRSR